jgi:hypothetical protein
MPSTVPIFCGIPDMFWLVYLDFSRASRYCHLQLSSSPPSRPKTSASASDRNRLRMGFDLKEKFAFRMCTSGSGSVSRRHFVRRFLSDYGRFLTEHPPLKKSVSRPEIPGLFQYPMLPIFRTPLMIRPAVSLGLYRPSQIFLITLSNTVLFRNISIVKCIDSYQVFRGQYLPFHFDSIWTYFKKSKVRRK